MTRPKVLLVDDDKDLLDLYREILAQLPSLPEIFTSSSGARAIAMMEAEPFTMLVCDLNMPKMDGLQVLSIVRRKFPELRTVVLTSVLDEQFRSRVYGLGVDLFWQKPGSGEEIKQFLECVESLLGRDFQSGFRGVQSKSLVDIIQLECLSQNSIVLKITNGAHHGRIWIQTGEVIHSSTGELVGEAAFRRILSWKAGNFETLPHEPHQPQTIFNSYQGLLLETAQAQDEANSQAARPAMNGEGNSPMGTLEKVPGAEYVLILRAAPDPTFDAFGLGHPETTAQWGRHLLSQFRGLGDRLQAGPLQAMECLGPRRNVAMAPDQKGDFCVGWAPDQSAGDMQESMKKLMALWGS